MNESVVQVPEWQEIAWLRHGFSTRRGGVSTVYRAAAESGGDLNTGWTATDDPGNVVENRRRLIAAVDGTEHGFGQDSLVTVRQIHSTRSLVVPETWAQFATSEGRAAFEADGLMTSFPGYFLGVQTADCVPVLVVDVSRRVVAAFHAGWRGTVGGIVQEGIAQMAQEYGSQPENLKAAIGPSIGACCYSVGDEVREAFGKGFPYAEDLFQRKNSDTGQKMHLDLWEANRQQLLDSGLPASHISVVGECSGCTGLPGQRKYFSHRCENGFTGRMMSVIGMISPE